MHFWALYLHTILVVRMHFNLLVHIYLIKFSGFCVTLIYCYGFKPKIFMVHGDLFFVLLFVHHAKSECMKKRELQYKLFIKMLPIYFNNITLIKTMNNCS